MNFPYLTENAIEGAAADLVQRVFGSAWCEHSPIELDTIVYDYLSPFEQLSFNDEAELPLENGEVVLGKTLPLRGQILLNRVLKLEAEPGRMRFTIAHEIGHWVLHRKLFLAQLEELDLFATDATASPDFAFTDLNRSVFPSSCRSGMVPREEWQANRFAVALLINPVVLREEFALRFGAPPAAWATQEWRYKAKSVRDLALLLGRCNTTSVHVPLRQVFGLSTEAMAIALESGCYVVEDAPLM